MQQSLFGETEQIISLDYIVNDLNVSSATVRNWIKTGYLVLYTKNQITLSSYEKFKKEIIGTEKLNKRANKTLKLHHNHDELMIKIDEMLHDGGFNGNIIANFYEQSLSNSYRNIEGIYYTPYNITQSFFQFLPKNKEDLFFCDPCCGSGNFLIEALKQGFLPHNIYGFDMDETAIKIAQRRFFEYTGQYSSCISVANGLEILNLKKNQFDVIITNPPWGKKLSVAEKNQWSNIFQTERSKDTFALFFNASLLAVKENGYLGFLMPESFFNIGIYEDSRKKALKNQIIALMDFGKAFAGLMTSAQGIMLQKKMFHYENKITCITDKQDIYQVRQSRFQSNPKLILNFNCNEQELTIINYLLSKKHITLENKAIWGLGIVTGNNKKYCKETPQENDIPIYKGSDINKGTLKQPSTFIQDDFSLFQQVAPIELFKAPEKIMYKFIANHLSCVYDNEQKFCLNSANFFILNNDFPLTHQQLSDLLNSEIMTWLFKKIFNTHKVLRKDLESLPIFVDFFKENSIFSEELFLNYLGLEKQNGTYRIKI